MGDRAGDAKSETLTVQDDLSVSDDRAEFFRTCSLLESIATQFNPASPEHQAIKDAASAFIIVHQRQSLRSAFQKLKSAVGGEMSEEMTEKLRSMGIDPEELDADDES